MDNILNACLKSLLEEADIAESKAFLRSFIKRIEVNKRQATIHYNLPLPPDGKIKQDLEVLPTVTLGGAGGTIGRTFELTFSLTI